MEFLRETMQPRDYQTLLLCSFIGDRKNFVRLSPELDTEAFTEPELRSVYESMIDLGSKFSIPELATAVEAHGGIALVRDISQSYNQYGMDKNIGFRDSRRLALAVDKLGRINQVKQLVSVAERKIEGLKGKALAKFDDDAFIANLVSKLVSRQSGSRQKGFREYDFYLQEYTVRLKKILSGAPPEDRLATGWKTFNKQTGGGLPVPGLVVLGGLPGSGKTQWALQFVVDVAKRIRKNKAEGVCAINSAEMTGVDLIARSILSAANVDSALLRMGGYSQDKGAIKRILSELEQQKSLPIFIDDSEFLTSNIIRSRVTALKAQYKNVVLVVTDFAELVVDSGENQVEKVANVVINAKALAKLLGCCVVLIAHMNRQAELTGTKIPNMRQFKYSAMFEQMADAVLLTYYPYFYTESGQKIIAHPQMPAKKGVSYIIIPKYRNGPIGFIPMGWDAQYTYWSDLGPKTKLVSSKED